MPEGIDLDEVRRLHNLGWSVRKIADHFKDVGATDHFIRKLVGKQSLPGRNDSRSPQTVPRDEPGIAAASDLVRLRETGDSSHHLFIAVEKLLSRCGRHVLNGRAPVEGRLHMLPPPTLMGRAAS